MSAVPFYYWEKGNEIKLQSQQCLLFIGGNTGIIAGDS